VTFLTHNKNLKRQATDSVKTLDHYYAQSQSLKKNTPTQQEPRTVTFLAVGDISLSRGIAHTIQTKQDPLYPFRGIEQLLKLTDFNFGNLETPFSSSNAFNPNKTMVFNAPKPNVAGLVAYNFAVLNLANNHALDQGLDGVRTTTQVLDQNGLLHTGVGNTLEDAWRSAVIEKNGIKIGFIGASYASINDGGKSTNNYVARIEDVDHLKTTIYKLKTTTDFIVVTMHAGTEYTATPNDAQIKFAHAAVDAGADMVIGAHPHWVQEKELYCPRHDEAAAETVPTQRTMPKQNGDILDGQLHSISALLAPPTLPVDCKPIYYSLGNFIFDQSWSEQTKKGLTLKITLSKTDTSTPILNDAATLNDLQPAGGTPKSITNIKTIEEIPIYIKENCCPTFNKK
jgi:poly-gamma-glutamate synthesis protein (capsule biosynthesis protein)